MRNMLHVFLLSIRKMINTSQKQVLFNVFDIGLLFEKIYIYILHNAVHLQISVKTICDNNLHPICKLKTTCHNDEAKIDFDEFLGTT